MATATHTNAPSLPLYPHLGAPEEISAFQKSRTVAFALSPRANEVVVFDTPKDSTNFTPSGPRSQLYFAHWNHVRRVDLGLYTDTYVPFDALQKMARLEQSNEGIQTQSAQKLRDLHQIFTLYSDCVQNHVARLTEAEPFDQAHYDHYASVSATLDLFSIAYTSSHGNVSNALVGEELLFWLNAHYVSPSSEEGPALDALEEPYLSEDYWNFIIRCVLRGIHKSALYFLQKLQESHPSRRLRRLLTSSVIPIIKNHPRSTDYETEHEYLAAHRRWKDTMVKPFVRVADDLVRDEDDEVDPSKPETEGDWRTGLSILAGIFDGDKESFLSLVKDQGWGWRDAIGVWGIWVDAKLNREMLVTTLPRIVNAIPVNPSSAEEVVQSSILSYDSYSAITAAREWNLWLAVHAADILSKLGELEEDDGEGSPRDPDQPPLLASLLESYASHLHSDPQVWEITLEYYSAAALVAASSSLSNGVGYASSSSSSHAMVAEIIRRVSIDPVIPAPSTKGKERDDGMDEEEDGENKSEEEKAWEAWDEKIQKIIEICVSYGLEDVLFEVAKGIAQTLTRRGSYGRAVKFCILARDGRALSRVADLLLQEYITKGPAEFIAQVASIPSELLPSATSTLHAGTTDIFSSRLAFISRYAEFHAMYARGEKLAAARYLVVMLGARIVPKWWWGVILIDAAGLARENELLFSIPDTYDLLRHLEEIYIRAEQGSGADYLGALESILNRPSEENNTSSSSRSRRGDKAGGASESVEGFSSALDQLLPVRLTFAKYLARCSTAGLV